MARATLFRARTAALVLTAILGLSRISTAQGRIRHVQPPDLENNPRYSQVVVVEEGKVIYVSGQVAHDNDGKLVGRGDLRAQAKQVFENLKIALAAAGSDFAHVVQLNSYLTDMSQLPAYRDVRLEYLSGLPHPPASTTIGVTRLVDPDALLEVEAIAVVAKAPSSPRKKPR